MDVEVEGQAGRRRWRRGGTAVAPNTVGRLLREPGLQPAGQPQGQGRAVAPGAGRPVPLPQRAGAGVPGRGQPVLSVDTKKKELVGDFKNGGRTWRPRGDPVRVQRARLPLAEPRARPSPTASTTSGRTAASSTWAPATTRPPSPSRASACGGSLEGRARYPAADALLICADSGGSNSTQSRVWKAAPAGAGRPLRLPITVCHLPPGTSKWNKIEHRLFAYISIHWRGRPLVDYETVVSLIGTTTTDHRADRHRPPRPRGLPHRRHRPGRRHGPLALRPHAVHPQWNYTRPLP